MSTQIDALMRQRPFAYAEIFAHPPLPGAAFDSRTAQIKADIPREIASVCKNESNCTVFLNDGTWFTSWSQGAHEHSPDERIVFALSRDQGRTWSSPQPIVASDAQWRRPYGVPYVVPGTGRIYFFYMSERHDLPWANPENLTGRLHFVYSDNRGNDWSEPQVIRLPDRDINVFPDCHQGWLNHPPQLMPTGELILPISFWQCTGLRRRDWKLTPAECAAINCENLLTETDPAKLTFKVLPDRPWGIRADVCAQRDNPALQRLLAAHGGGRPELSAFNFQELTVVPLDDGRWLGVGRTFLGSPGFTVSADRGRNWTAVDRLRYEPDGEFIKHPMTMCPLARMADGRLILLFTNNDGSQRGAADVWDGDGKTRNPQWLAVGRQLPGETRNGGVKFGRPFILADVDDSGETNLKTGVSMPHFFQSQGRNFVAYNINKEHILLDEIPMSVLDAATP